MNKIYIVYKNSSRLYQCYEKKLASMQIALQKAKDRRDGVKNKYHIREIKKI